MAATRSVAVLSRVPNLFNTLNDSLPKLKFHEIKPEAKNVIELLNSAEIVVSDGDLIAPHIYKLSNIKWIQGTWAGIDPIMKFYDRSKGPPPFPLVRFTGKHFGTMMSEYVVSHVVAFERDFKSNFQNQRLKIWDNSKYYNTIGDMSVGILGIGSIGSHVAGVMKSLGATVWGLVRKHPKVKLESVDEYRLTHEVDELLASCDLIINILPHTQDTVGFLNLERFSRCRGALFVNIGRGSISTESDLIKALDQEYLRGAILDVFPQEPLPTTSELWNKPQVTITPHVAGLTRAKDVVKQFEYNLKKWESGRELPHLVDFESGY